MLRPKLYKVGKLCADQEQSHNASIKQSNYTEVGSFEPKSHDGSLLSLWIPLRRAALKQYLQGEIEARESLLGENSTRYKVFRPTTLSTDDET